MSCFFSYCIVLILKFYIFSGSKNKSLEEDIVESEKVFFSNMPNYDPSKIMIQIMIFMVQDNNQASFLNNLVALNIIQI